MKLVYVCSTGQRRSPVIAAHTKRIIESVRDVGRITVGYAGVRELNSEAERRRYEKELSRLRKLARTSEEKEFIEAIDYHGDLIDPKVSYTLLKESVDEVFELPRFPLESRNEGDIYLALDEKVKKEVENSIPTVIEFLRLPETNGLRDSRYLLPTLRHQLGRDRRLSHRLERYAHAVVEKVMDERRQLTNAHLG